MTDTEMITGYVAPDFELVHDALRKILNTGAESGCQVAVTIGGDIMVDLCAGHIDREQLTPVTPRTLIPVFSVSKAVSALVVASIVEEGVFDYDDPVADHWPEFAAHGKGRVTVGQMLSHQAGVPGIPDNWEARDWYDWERATARLAALEPLWEPGGQSGYHAISWGHLAGELVRRTTGATIGQHLRQRFGQPFSLDVWIGLPESEFGRAANHRKPSKPPNLGELNTPTQIAFLKPWSSPRYGRGDEHAWLSREIPAANGHATAAALSVLMQPLALKGRLKDTQLLGPATLDASMAERIAGQDLVLPYNLSWAAGLIRNTSEPARHYYGPGSHAVGHTGSGGSCVLADPDTGLTFAYTTLKHSPALVEDDRANTLIAAVYDCL